MGRLREVSLAWAWVGLRSGTVSLLWARPRIPCCAAAPSRIESARMCKGTGPRGLRRTTWKNSRQIEDEGRGTRDDLPRRTNCVGLQIISYQWMLRFRCFKPCAFNYNLFWITTSSQQYRRTTKQSKGIQPNRSFGTTDTAATLMIDDDVDELR